MTISIRDAGTWRGATPYVKDGGTWKALTAGYVKDAGTWKQFFAANTDVVSISATAVTGFKITPTDVTVTYSIDAAGTITRVVNGVLNTVGTWITPGSSAANYQVMATYVSGDTLSGGSGLGTWLNCTSDQAWFLTNTFNGDNTKQTVIFVQIRRASDGVVVASANVTITATVTT